jgi:PPK2 family polyphosphate:nucleotide phosphotransferase
MIDPVASPYRVPFDGSFKLKKAPTAPPEGTPGKKKLKKRLEASTDELSELQRCLYANDKHALLLVFQAMDAAGKDSTIRAVMSGINPAGCQVYSFKRPSAEEYDHDFLWRTAVRLPERGRIGIFNRSYYESVLVVKVHPEFLGSEKLPGEPRKDLDSLWKERYASIREHELHLARNGTVIVKFFLNVSRDEQKARFLARIDVPTKNWKFSAGDLKERKLWPNYMKAYQAALNATSRPHAPWYAIPADDKPFMRATVADIVTRTIAAIGPKYPVLSEEETAALQAHRKALESEDA